MNRLTSLYRALPNPAKRVFWTITAIGSVLVGFSISLIGSLLTSPGINDLIATSMPFVLSFIAVISAISILYNRIQFGAWLFFISTMIAMLVIPFVQEGYAFPAAVLVLVVTILIPLQVVSGRYTTLATVSGFLVGAAIIAVDTFWPGKRAEIGLENLQNARIGTIGLAIILFVAIFALYRTFFLRTKLLLLTLGASLLSVIAVAGAASFYIEAALSKNSQATLLTASRHVADSIDTYIEFNTELVTTEASLPAFSRYLSNADTRLQDLAEVQRTIQQLAQRDIEAIGSYALLDKNGFTVWDSYTPDISGDKSNRDYFINPFRTGTPYVSWVRFSPTSIDHSFYIGAPVRDPVVGTILGVLRVRLRTTALDEIVKNNEGAAGPGSYAILLDEYNLVISNPFNSEFKLRSVGKLPSEQIALLKEQDRISANYPETELSLGMTDFAKGLNNINTIPFFESADAAFDEPVQGTAVYLSKRPWKVAFVQPISVALAPVQEQTRAITTAALITSFLLGIATLFVSRTITEPVARLTNAAEQISAGNLDIRAEVTTHDELGTLASTINDMSEQLKQTLAGLETTIAERTADLELRGQELAQRSADLEIANQRSERRASQLFAVSTVANAIATVQNPDELLPLITRTISDQFGFYHIGIFLNDANNQFAVLRAANSEGGQRMLLRGHRLKIGETGIVGNVASTGRPRIALDTGADAVFFNNPDLPDTRSEMALPLRSGPIVIGVLDVQSLEPNAYSDEDVEILGVLAGQVSIAIRNAQLFDEIQRSASELQMLLQQDAREQWQRVIHHQKRAGYYYNGAAVTSLEKPAEKDEDVILVPITIRGQTIGKLGIRTPAGYKLKPDELDVIKAVGERLAISAENARLLEDSQLRAAKERTIGKISERIGSSANLDSVFRALMEELGQVLPESEILIQFNQENG